MHKLGPNPTQIAQGRVRKEVLGVMMPVISSGHAREQLISDMQNLPLPDAVITDPMGLHNSAAVAEWLSQKNDRIIHSARKDGVMRIEEDRSFKGMHKHGYGDRHITALAASAVGQEVILALAYKGAITEMPGLADYGKMFQTGWFGVILNQMALTVNGKLQPHFRERTEDITPQFEKAIQGTPQENTLCAVQFDLKPLGTDYMLQYDNETGLNYLELSKAARSVLRAAMPKHRSIGCPVARTAVKATAEQVAFLEEYDHISEGNSSGFAVERELQPGVFKVSQGAYTAIDDVLWHWGEYVLDYCDFVTNHGEEYVPGVSPTKLNEVVLLD